jgi:hypothetical protein
MALLIAAEKNDLLSGALKTTEGKKRLATAMQEPIKRKIEKHINTKLNWGTGGGVYVNTICSHPCVDVYKLFVPDMFNVIDELIEDAANKVAELIVSLGFDSEHIRLDLKVTSKDVPKSLLIGFMIEVKAHRNLALPDLI